MFPDPCKRWCAPGLLQGNVIVGDVLGAHGRTSCARKSDAEPVAYGALILREDVVGGPATRHSRDGGVRDGARPSGRSARWCRLEGQVGGLPASSSAAAADEEAIGRRGGGGMAVGRSVADGAGIGSWRLNRQDDKSARGRLEGRSAIRSLSPAHTGSWGKGTGCNLGAEGRNLAFPVAAVAYVTVYRIPRPRP